MSRRICRTFALLVGFLTSLAATGDGETTNPAAEPAPASERLVNDRCPVMTDEFTTPLHELAIGGVTVRFCCDKCRGRFEADPAPYLSHLPQITPAIARQILATSRNDMNAQRAERWLDRWMRPLALTAAGVLTVWLVVRIARRGRREMLARGTETPPAE